MPQDPRPLAARAFGTRDLPRLFLKSGYGPELAAKRVERFTTHAKTNLALATNQLVASCGNTSLRRRRNLTSVINQNLTRIEFRLGRRLHA